MALIVVALGWIAAIVAVAAWNAPWWMAAAWVAAATPAAAVFGSRKALLVAAAACVLALAGGWRFDSWHSRPLPGLAAFTGEEVTIEGTITSLPDPGTTTVRYELRASRVRTDHWIETDGKALLTLDQYAEYKTGAVVYVKGKLAEPPVVEGFDYPGYLARKDIVGTMLFPEVEVIREPKAWNYRYRTSALRHHFERALQRSLPEPEASLAAGIAIGRDEAMPRDLVDDYRATGLAHLVAVSGSNVALVTIIVFVVAIPIIGRNWATGPAVATAFLYMLLAGLSPTVVRASIMAGIALAGYVAGRPRSGLHALALAVVIMTALTPAVALDAGFQLSVAATAGIIAFTPWIESGIGRGLRATKLDPLIPPGAVTAASLTLAATLATLPIVWSTFERVSLIGPLANVIAAPLFALAFWLSLATGALGMAWDEAGWAAGLAAYYPLALINAVARTLARVPLADISVSGGNTDATVLAYLILGAAGWFAYRYPPDALPWSPRPPPATRVVRRLSASGLAAAVVAGVAMVSFAPMRAPGHLEITMLDVGQGDAILVTTPGGTRILVDGGPSGIQLAREVGATLPHWERRIDVVMLSHPQQDHVAGLVELLRRYDVGQVIDAGVTNDTRTFALFDAEAPARTIALRGDRFEWDGVTFEVLWPTAQVLAGIDGDQLNDASLVLRIQYGQTSVLLTGDIGSAAQRALLALEDVGADVHKVPHHGSATSDMAFLDAVGEAVALVSVGAGNRYGHPDKGIIDRLSDAKVYRTDLHGRVTVTSDGQRLRIRAGP